MSDKKPPNGAATLDDSSTPTLIVLVEVKLMVTVGVMVGTEQALDATGLAWTLLLRSLDHRVYST